MKNGEFVLELYFRFVIDWFIRFYAVILKKNHFIFLELWPFKKLGILNLSAGYLEKYLFLGLETWSTDTGWWVDYLIKLN